MPLVTVKVDEELKRKMGKFRHINWSEVIRQSIIDIVESREEGNLAKAILLNEEYVIVPEEGYSSTELIRELRESVRWRKR
jgi:hypothetical protein